MPHISQHELDNKEREIDRLFYSVRRYDEEEVENVKNYFQFEALTDTDKQWSNLHTIFYEDYVPCDIFYVPFRRKVTIGWLELLRYNRRHEMMYQSLETDAIYTKYCLFLNDYLPFSSSVQGTQFSPYNLKNHPILCSPNKKTFSKRKIWAIIQHKKCYYRDIVPEYDDLFLKYDKVRT